MLSWAGILRNAKSSAELGKCPELLNQTGLLKCSFGQVSSSAQPDRFTQMLNWAGDLKCSIRHSH